MKRAVRPLLSLTQTHKKSVGCRLLDYSSPATHMNVPKSKYLLSSRFGFRYENQEPYQEKNELLTIAELLLRKLESSPNTEVPQWPELRSRLGLAPDSNLQDLRHCGLNFTHINVWVDCIEQSTLLDALKVVTTHPETPWPGFVILYTFGRHASSPFEVYEAVRTYQIVLPTLPFHQQPEVLALLLKMCQKSLLDLVPVVVRTFLKVHKREISAPVFNEILWIIARFGKRWSAVDTGILADTQELLVRAVGSDKIDAKGIFALSYVTHFRKPLVAREFINEMKALAVSRTPPNCANDFAYSNGPAVINLLTSSTAEDALRIADETPKHKSAMWTCVSLYLSRSKLLTSDVALRLWVKVVRSKIRVTSLFTELILGSVRSYHLKWKVLAHALAVGIRTTPSLVSRMMKVSTKADLDLAMAQFPQFLSNRLVSEQIMVTQSFCDPASVWNTYSRIRDAHGQPSRKALRTLCRTAWDTKLIWDGMYASQLALAEFKMHVRGLSVPADDLLRLFPDDNLLYAYVVMVGRAGYTGELVGFLSWVEDIGSKPSKQVLMALIHHSPQGPALLKLGLNTRPPSSEWPSEEEYDLYVQMLEA